MVDRTSIRILSLDSGNRAQAAVPLFVLSEIEQRLGTSISSLFDVVAGVGSSAFLAAGLVIPDEGEELNSATELTTFYLRNIKKFNPLPRRFGFKPAENPFHDFFKDSKLGEAKIELFLPMLDLAKGELAEVSSWNARQDADQPRDFSVSELVQRSMADVNSTNLKPLVAADGSKYLLASAGQVLSNPSQALYTAVSNLCSPETEIQVVSLSSGVANAGFVLADLRVMEPSDLAVQLTAISGVASAQQVDASLSAQLSPSTYRRINYKAAELDKKALHKINLKTLTHVQQAISTEVQKLDLGFLT